MMIDDWNSFVECAIDYAFIVISDSATIEKWSPGAETILGWTAEEIVGKPFETIFTTPDRVHHAHELELEKAKRTGLAEDSRWHLRNDSTSVYVNGVTRWLPEERVFLKVVRNVTEHPRAERRTESFLEVTSLIASADNPDLALPHILERLGEDLLWDAAALWLRGAHTRLWERDDSGSLETILRETTIEDPPISTCLVTPGIDWSTNLRRGDSRLIRSLRERRGQHDASHPVQLRDLESRE